MSIFTPKNLIQVRVDELTPHPQNARKHPPKQMRRLVRNIQEFGFVIPVLIDGSARIICGHARVEAAKRLKMPEVPAVRVTDLSEAQVRAFLIADNRLAEMAQWDEPILAENFQFLSDQELDFDLDLTGFEYGEVEQLISQASVLVDGDHDADEPDEVPDADSVPPVCQTGDVWRLGRHRVICADATDLQTYDNLFRGATAAMVITDPPYNLPARDIGRVCADQHGDFAMAAGEMSADQFTDFLGSVMEQMRRFSEPGSIHYLFMDWRHTEEMLAAGRKNYAELKNLCVWVKERPGMGSFYRSQHELVFVFKNGPLNSPHQNNFELGQFGRSRSNVWRYPSARSLNAADGDPNGDEVLKTHPTIKGVRMIEDAVLDCSRRGEIVLDAFLGSGSTLIACEKTHRLCYGIELAPRYVDVGIHRWQEWTGEDAVHEVTGESYAERMAQRGDTNGEEVEHAG